MTTIERQTSTFDINPETFHHVNLKNYVKTYFLNGSLYISSEVPILILENISKTDSSGGYFEICVSNHHPFYNIFKDISKDNIELYNTYFKEKYSTSKIKDKITLRLHYNQEKFLDEKRMWCKLDTQVKIGHYEGILYDGDRDSKYVDYWFFILDLNKIEFV